jgi:hypothetical protein
MQTKLLYPTDLTDSQWNLIKEMLPAPPTWSASNCVSKNGPTENTETPFEMIEDRPEGLFQVKFRQYAATFGTFVVISDNVYFIRRK